MKINNNIKIIFEVLLEGGTKAGIYIQSNDSIINDGHKNIIKLRSKESNYDIYYEIKYYLEQCLDGNIDTIKLLYTKDSNILIRTRHMLAIYNMRHDFINKNFFNKNISLYNEYINKYRNFINNAVDSNNIKTPLNFLYVPNFILSKFTLFMHYINSRATSEEKNINHYYLTKSTKDNLIFLNYNTYIKDFSPLINDDKNELVFHNPRVQIPSKTLLYFDEENWKKYYKNLKHFRKNVIKKNNKDMYKSTYLFYKACEILYIMDYAIIKNSIGIDIDGIMRLNVIKNNTFSIYDITSANDVILEKIIKLKNKIKGPDSKFRNKIKKRIEMIRKYQYNQDKKIVHEISKIEA